MAGLPTPGAAIRLAAQPSLATLDVFEDEKVSSDRKPVSKIVEAGLRRIEELPHVAAVRGEGMVWGIELADFGGRSANDVAVECVRDCYLGDADGNAIHLLGPLAGKVIRISPPLTMTPNEAPSSGWTCCIASSDRPATNWPMAEAPQLAKTQFATPWIRKHSMSLVVVGSLAIDQVVTPKGEKECLGGSASYFAYVASFFGPVRLVGVVGEDFPKPYMKLFEDRKSIDTSGIQHQPGKTFRWKGKYSEDMNSRETLEVHLNVFGEFDPVCRSTSATASSSSSATRARSCR